MPRKTINIKLYTSELLYDIQANTHLTAESKVDAKPELVALIKANDDDLSENAILRAIASAVAMLQNSLSEYISEECASADNELISRSENISLTLDNLPSNFNEASTESIARLAHQYIMYMALFEWYNATSPNDASDCGKIATNALLSIRSAINKRVRPQRQTPHK